MRGKKIDTEFISNYLSKSKDLSYNELVEKTLKKINKFEKRIAQAEAFKKQRSKFIDVLLFLKEKPAKQDINIDFYKVPLNTAFAIIHDIELLDPKLLSQEQVLCVKSLLEFGIIELSDNFFIKSVRFDSFVEFLDYIKKDHNDKLS